MGPGHTQLRLPRVPDSPVDLDPRLGLRNDYSTQEPFTEEEKLKVTGTDICTT